MEVGIRVTAVSAAAVEQRHRTVDRYIDTAAVHAREKGEEVNEKRIFFFFSLTVFLLLNSLLSQFTPNNTCRYECPFFFSFFSFLFFSFRHYCCWVRKRKGDASLSFSVSLILKSHGT